MKVFNVFLQRPEVVEWVMQLSAFDAVRAMELARYAVEPPFGAALVVLPLDKEPENWPIRRIGCLPSYGRERGPAPEFAAGSMDKFSTEGAA